MAIPDVKEKWSGSINEVTLGATKEQGGTRGKTVTVGGHTTLPFLTTEGVMKNPPVIAGFVADTVPDWPDFVKKAIGDEVNSPVEWAQKNVEEFKTDLINLKLIGADPVTTRRTTRCFPSALRQPKGRIASSVLRRSPTT
jgi:acetyl-CoA decarbonylase/synthase complex subunit delta